MLELLDIGLYELCNLANFNQMFRSNEKGNQLQLNTLNFGYINLVYLFIQN